MVWYYRPRVVPLDRGELEGTEAQLTGRGSCEVEAGNGVQSTVVVCGGIGGLRFYLSPYHTERFTQPIYPTSSFGEPLCPTWGSCRRTKRAAQVWWKFTNSRVFHRTYSVSQIRSILFRLIKNIDSSVSVFIYILSCTACYKKISKW